MKFSRAEVHQVITLQVARAPGCLYGKCFQRILASLFSTQYNYHFSVKRTLTEITLNSLNLHTSIRNIQTKQGKVCLLYFLFCISSCWQSALYSDYSHTNSYNYFASPYCTMNLGYLCYMFIRGKSKKDQHEWPIYHVQPRLLLKRSHH